MILARGSALRTEAKSVGIVACEQTARVEQLGEIRFGRECAHQQEKEVGIEPKPWLVGRRAVDLRPITTDEQKMEDSGTCIVRKVF